MKLKPTRPENTFEDRLRPRKGKNWRKPGRPSVKRK